MKIIDEHGSPIENPDLTLGRLVEDAEIVHHDAVPGVEKVSHWVTTKTYPNGGRDVEEVIDVEPVAPMEAWDETVPVQRYILYTAEELAERKAQAEADQKAQEEREKLPETVKALQEENTMLRQCLLEISEIVYA